MNKLAIMTLLALFLSGPVYAAETVMHIKVTIIQCGEPDRMEYACQRDERCCTFIETAAGTGEVLARAENQDPIPAATDHPLPLIGIMQQTYVTE